MKIIKFLLFMILISSIITGDPSDCSSPLDCYAKAVSALKQDREEMRRQLDNYQILYKNALSEISTLKKSIEDNKSEYENNKLIIKQGEVGMSNCNFMYESTGERNCKIVVLFDREFKETPKITYSPVLFDLNGSSNRLNIWLADISKIGFTINMSTWSDSKVYYSRISWTAIGK